MEAKAFSDKIVLLEKQLTFANSEVSRLQTVLVEKENQIDQMNMGSLDQDELVKRHRNEIDQWRKKLKDKDKERDEWVEERNQFLVQIQDLKTQLSSAKAHDGGMTSEMINEVHFYQTEIDNWKNKCKGYENVFDELSKINEQLTAQAKANESKLKEQEAAISTMRILISQHEERERKSGDQSSQLGKMEARIKELERQLSDEVTKTQLISKQASEIDQEFVELKLKLDKATRERNKMSDEVEELKMKLELSEKKIQMKEEEIKRLNERIQTMKNE
jgi:chromosome segregation ATPase